MPIQPLQHLTLRRIRVILKASGERYRGWRTLSRTGTIGERMSANPQKEKRSRIH
jgi:hypothetical protein